MEKETLEEAAEEYKDDLTIDNLKLAFINGAKWQAERMYSEEEVINLLNEFSRHLIFNKSSDLTINHWFEQFKKK
jgi:hypothetical protein